MPSLFLSLMLLLPQSTQVDDVVVVAHRLAPLVSVTVDGDVDSSALVRSDPIGIRCGAHRFQYDAYAAPRLCWIRRPAGEVIHLRAENDAGFIVRWEGCEPSGDGRECTVRSAADGVQVHAVFARP